MRVLRSIEQRCAVPPEAVQAARRRADDAYRRWACVHRQLQQARRLLPPDRAEADLEAQARIARLEAEEERLFTEAGDLWRAYTRAQCAALWNSGSNSLLPRAWRNALQRGRHVLREVMAGPKLAARGKGEVAVPHPAPDSLLHRSFGHAGAAGSSGLKSAEGVPT